MNPQFLKELEALVKKHGYAMQSQCVYYGECAFSDHSQEVSWLVTITSDKREDIDA